MDDVKATFVVIILAILALWSYGILTNVIDHEQDVELLQYNYCDDAITTRFTYDGDEREPLFETFQACLEAFDG